VRSDYIVIIFIQHLTFQGLHIMATRTNKLNATIKPTVVEDAKVVNEVALPSITRVFGSLTAGAITTGSLGYFGFAAVEVVTLSTALLTGSAFATFMIWYLGAFMALVGAIMAGSYVQARILDGSLDVACGKARSYVASLFTFNKEVTA
jgi:hypothetical protein